MSIREAWSRRRSRRARLEAALEELTANFEKLAEAAREASHIIQHKRLVKLRDAIADMVEGSIDWVEQDHMDEAVPGYDLGAGEAKKMLAAIIRQVDVRSVG